jgi:hypothetical protein
MSAPFSIRIRLLAALALTACAAAAAAQTTPPTRESLTLDRERLLAQKRSLESSSRPNAQAGLEANRRAAEKSRKRIADLNDLWREHLKNGVSDADVIRKAIQDERDSVAANEKERLRLQAALDAINQQVTGIDRQVARVDEQLAGIARAERERERDRFKYAVVIDGGYAGSATFGPERYQSAYRFRRAMDSKPDSFKNVTGPEHPFTGDYSGVAREWVVTFWVEKGYKYQEFGTQQEAEECQKKLLKNGLHAHWDKVAK